MASHSDMATMASEMAKMAEIIAQLQKNQTTELKIPLIPKLTKAEDLNTWKDKLFRMLQRFDLEKYIEEDVPEPEDARERREWLTDRLNVDDYIQATVPDIKVWNALRGLGWSAKNSNPKKTLDYVTQYFEKGAVDTLVNLHLEFANARLKNFDSIASYLARINFLRERLDASAFKMTDEAYTWIALKGIQSEFTDLYARCVARIQTSTPLTWADLMAELHSLAVSQTFDLGFASVAVEQPKKKKNDNSLVKCDKCWMMIKPGYRHCDDCGWHPGGATCWSCEPEKAPDGWPRKSEFLFKRNTPNSPTGPIHQQSGVAHPIVNTRALLWLSNHEDDEDPGISLSTEPGRMGANGGVG